MRVRARVLGTVLERTGVPFGVCFGVPFGARARGRARVAVQVWPEPPLPPGRCMARRLLVAGALAYAKMRDVAQAAASLRGLSRTAGAFPVPSRALRAVCTAQSARPPERTLPKRRSTQGTRPGRLPQEHVCQLTPFDAVSCWLALPLPHRPFAGRAVLAPARALEYVRVQPDSDGKWWGGGIS